MTEISALLITLSRIFLKFAVDTDSGGGLGDQSEHKEY